MDLQKWMPIASTAPMLFGFVLAGLLPYPWGLVVFLTLYIVSSGLTLALQPIASLLAKKFHYLWAQPSSDEAMWAYKGRLLLQIKGTLPDRTDFLPGLVLSDGSFAVENGQRGIYQSYYKPENRPRHPRYNNRKRIPLVVIRHIHPVNELMPFADGQYVVYKNLPATASATWADFDEVMPSITEMSNAANRRYNPALFARNHVPFMLEDGRMCPVYEVRKAKGSFMIDKKLRESQAQRFVMSR